MKRVRHTVYFVDTFIKDFTTWKASSNWSCFLASLERRYCCCCECVIRKDLSKRAAERTQHCLGLPSRGNASVK